MHFFDRSRAYVAAHGIGLAQGALDQAVKHVKERKQFGQPLGSFQVTQTGSWENSGSAVNRLHRPCRIRAG